MNELLVYTDRIKEAREHMKLTYEEMSKKLGYNSKSTYMYIETGRTVPTLPIMRKISEILGYEVGYFFNLEVRETRTCKQEAS